MNISFQNKKLTCLQADVLVNIFVSCVTDFLLKPFLPHIHIKMTPCLFEMQLS